MYTIEDLNNPISIGESDAGHNLLDKAITNAFYGELQYTCLNDIPYIEYNPDTGELEVDDLIYEIDECLQKYLSDADEQLNTIPLPQIKLRPIDIEVTHPKEDGQKGFMKIGNINQII